MIQLPLWAVRAGLCDSASRSNHSSATVASVPNDADLALCTPGASCQLAGRVTAPAPFTFRGYSRQVGVWSSVRARSFSRRGRCSLGWGVQLPLEKAAWSCARRPWTRHCAGQGKEVKLEMPAAAGCQFIGLIGRTAPNADPSIFRQQGRDCLVRRLSGRPRARVVGSVTWPPRRTLHGACDATRWWARYRVWPI